jgi:hypothetical protein
LARGKGTIQEGNPRRNPKEVRRTLKGRGGEDRGKMKPQHFAAERFDVICSGFRKPSAKNR